MNLKESYQYQNYITSLFNQAAAHIGKENYTKVTSVHLRTKADPNGIDETIVETADSNYPDVSVETMICFALELISEKERLGRAITDAKYCAKSPWGSEIDIDAQLAANKNRHELAYLIQNLMAARKKTSMTSGTGYRINTEGNQTPYVYPIEKTVEYVFDRNYIKKLLADLKTESSKLSMQAEKAMLDEKVTFEPIYSISDSFEDALAAFVEREEKRRVAASSQEE